MNNGLYSQSCGDTAATAQKKRMLQREYEDNAKQCATEQYQTKGLAGCSDPESLTMSEEISSLRSILAETRNMLDAIKELVVGQYPCAPCDDPSLYPKPSLVAQASECKQMAHFLLCISQDISAAL